MSTQKKHLSIVIPAYNEAGNLEELCARIAKALESSNLIWELIIVDDSSTDETFDTAVRLREQFPTLRVLRLSRNFGHQAAIWAGMHAARGDAIVVMDGDLQHPPELIPALIEKWREGHLIVNTRRVDSRSSAGLLKRNTSRFFYWAFRVLSGLPLSPGAADFRLMDRKAADQIMNMPEANLFLRGMVVWIGHSQASIDYQPGKRSRGRSSYSLVRMLRLALSGILAFSVAPLYWAVAFGTVLALFSFAYAAYAVYVRCVYATAIRGWASLAVLITFLFGVHFIFLGLLGAYLGATYREAKKRPSYVLAADVPPLEEPW